MAYFAVARDPIRRIARCAIALNWGDLRRLQCLTWLVERTKERTKEQCSQLTLKNNAAAGYKGPLKPEFLKGTGLLFKLVVHLFL